MATPQFDTVRTGWARIHSPLILLWIGAAWVQPLAADPHVISLAGEWRFEIDRASQQLERSKSAAADLPQGDGLAEGWFRRPLGHRLRLPGILQAQGYGDPISPSTPWVLTLGDAWWQLQPPALRDAFSHPGSVEVPFLSQPPRHYLGAAWYQRDIVIPPLWAGMRVSLFLEHPHWETRVWLDETPHPADHGLSAPHVLDFGILAVGTHQLTIRVDNRRIVSDPVNNGHFDDSHSVSDALGAAWNGIVGSIELRATTPVWIDDAQVFPDVASRTARLRVRIGSAAGRPGVGQLSAGGVSVPVSWQASGGQMEFVVPLGSGARTWDEFHPELQRLDLRLSGDGAKDSRALVFGLREISHRGSELLLNGRPINLRLTHFGGDFPLTGYPATDVDSWRRIVRVCRDYGLNGIRFHSWCPPEAAFVAADEMGFYLQPECGMWAPLSPGGPFAALLEEETARMLAAFGNHPSFILLSPSNEPSGHYQQVTPRWAAQWHERDGRRLYSAGTGWSDPAQVEGGAQYATLVRYQGAELRNTSGWFGGDYRRAVAGVGIPILAHEVGQWCAYPDFNVMRAFTGYLRPGNYGIFSEIARRQGVFDDDARFAEASGRFQVQCYKEEIEANLRTPGLAGYQLLDLHDYLGQGTALIGVVDAFWQPKSYVKAAEFRRFNGPTVPLARLSHRTFANSEHLVTEVEIYHYGARPLPGARPYWSIVDASGRTVAAGDWAARDIPIGKNIPLGRLDVDLQALPAPKAYRLVVGLRRTDVENDWNFWVYPADGPRPGPSNVLVTRNWPDARAALSQGGRVLFVPAATDLDPSRCPPMKRVPVFWNIQMTVRPPRNPAARFDAMLGLLCAAEHPALAEFPTGSSCDWQWTPLIDNVRSVNLDGAPKGLKPIVAAIDDWNRDWRLGVIFECRVGRGRLLVSAVDVTAPDASAGLRQLRRSLLDYAASERFQPPSGLSAAEANRLWEIHALDTPAPGARALDPDLDDGSLRPVRPRT